MTYQEEHLSKIYSHVDLPVFSAVEQLALPGSGIQSAATAGSGGQYCRREVPAGA